ncbi:MAG: methyltransferase, partial [Gemmatimonadaceae bacterium]
MDQLWNEVDEYFAQRLAPSDDVLTAASAASAAAGLPAISVTVA